MPNEEKTEPKAKDLLPPDPPEEPLKKIAERRVVGWFMANRLVERVDWRPAGNSKKFWKRIEDDDPFIRRRVPPRRVREDHTLYPADRIDRIPQSAVSRAPAPPPRPQPRPQPAPRPAPKPQAAAPPPARRAPPETKINPDPTSPQHPAHQTSAQRSAENPTAPEERRMPPRFPPPNQAKKKRSGRIRISKAEQPPTPQTGIIPGAREEELRKLRERKKAARTGGAVSDKPLPPKRSIDELIGMLSDLKAAEQQYYDEKEVEEQRKKDALARGETYVPRAPTIGPMAPAQDTAAPAPKAPPKPKAPAQQAKAPVDRTPPKPEPPAKKEPPKAPPKPASLDDLFGGPSEGRVRIGRPTKTGQNNEEGDSDSE